ncbi:MAG: cytidylyltransferase domain-containing protein [Nitrosarchaeum sp.]
MVNQKILCLVQARMGSTRLPGKVLKYLNGIPMICIIMQNLQRSKQITKSMVVTSNNPKDDILVDCLKKSNIEYFRGNENDVLSRFYNAAVKEKADLIVRITADCPLVDPEIVDMIIGEAVINKTDYCSNAEIRTFPRGYDVEVFTFNILKKMFFETKNPDDLEHVTLFIHKNLNMFNTLNVIAPQNKHHPEWRVCVDTEEDFQLMEKIFEYYKNKDLIKYDDVIDLFKKYSDLPNINKDVKQKTVKNEI